MEKLYLGRLTRICTDDLLMRIEHPHPSTLPFPTQTAASFTSRTRITGSSTIWS
jgi:hypothetical protein